MKIPPSGQPSPGVSGEGEAEPSRPSRPKRDTGREFRMPGRKEEKGKEKLKEKVKEKEKEEEKKKKVLADVTYAEAPKELKQGVAMGAEVKGAEKVATLTPAEAMGKITQLIQNMATEMRVGTVGGQNFVSLTLGKGPEVPQVFTDAHLTINVQPGGLVIQFDRFSSPQNEQTAIFIVEQNKEQLEDMMRVLAAKNIQVAQLNIGAHQVALPRIEPLPPPFQPAAPTGAEGRFPGEEGGEGGEGGEGEGEERE